METSANKNSETARETLDSVQLAFFFPSHEPKVIRLIGTTEEANTFRRSLQLVNFVLVGFPAEGKTTLVTHPKPPDSHPQAPVRGALESIETELHMS